MDESENIKWPGWETVRLIGQGSFGTVYEIQRQVFDDTEKAALKVISIPQNKHDIEEMYSDGYDEESITSTFQSHLKSIVAEYSMTRKMNDCVNIISCDDVRYVQHDDGIGWDIFIKMELLTPLTKSLPPQIGDDTVIKLALDMCNALEMCSKHNIVHRDIKPQNIFVSAAGDYKLGDFGIAKTVEKTMGGTKIGTYKYMAPEVYNNQPYGCGADIYSLGMVLYWLLNQRRLPFLPLPPEKLKAGMEDAARRRRMSGEPLPPPANGSEQLKAIVLKACAFDPQQRYQTPAQMRKDLLAAEQEWKMQNPELSGLLICPACGCVLEEDCRFCIYCGNPMSAARFQDPEAEETPEEEPVTAESAEEELPAEEPVIEEPAAEEPATEIVILDKWVKVPEPVAETEPVNDREPTMQCANCGAVLEPDVRFCTQCGTKQEPKAEAYAPAKAAPQKVQASGIPEVPTVEIPDVEIPDEEIPDVEVPAVEIPAVEVPVVEVPATEAPEVVQAPEKVCTQCGAALAQDAHFCTQCGARYVPMEESPEKDNVCKGCGAVLEPGNKFCIWCGMKL